METKPERFTYRYKTSFIPKYSILLELQDKYFSKKQELTLKQKDHFCLAIKYAYEYVWKTLKDYLKYKNKPALLPRNIFEIMSEYIDTSYWLELINDLYLFFAYRDNELILDKIINNYFEKYENIFKVFLDFIESEDIISTHNHLNDKEEYKFINSNHCVLDTYTIVTLVNHFRRFPKIELITLHGSRATSNYRISSDIDMFVKGNYTPDEFNIFANSLETLELPYLIDVCDATNISEKQTEFVERNFPESIPFYNKYDFE